MTSDTAAASGLSGGEKGEGGRPPEAIRGRIIIDRTSAAWESQQVQEPCILPNPKDPTRLVMFYSGVPAANRNLCYIGKAWAHASDPFTWHQDEANPLFGPGTRGWDSGSIRLALIPTSPCRNDIGGLPVRVFSILYTPLKQRCRRFAC